MLNHVPSVYFGLEITSQYLPTPSGWMNYLRYVLFDLKITHNNFDNNCMKYLSYK